MKGRSSTLVLAAQDIEKIIESIGINEVMDQLIERMYRAFVDFSEEDNIIPIRSGFSYSVPKEGLVEWMPIRVISQNEILMKIVGYHPQNPKAFELPTVISTISKYDTETGHLKALLDGVVPTALRTGAASAIASKLFAKSDSDTLGLIGCGVQSVTQLHALSRMFDFKKVLYFDTDHFTHKSFVEKVSILDLNVEFIESNIDEIIQVSDIVCTATSIGVGEGPLFEYEDSKEWLHVNAVGSDFEGKVELPKALLERSYVSPDMMEQALIEGECQQLKPDEIGKTLIDSLKSANQLQHLKNQLTVFDSTGYALEDEVVANLFLDFASKLNIGERVQIENTIAQEKNPYSFLVNKKTID